LYEYFYFTNVYSTTIRNFNNLNAHIFELAQYKDKYMRLLRRNKNSNKSGSESNNWFENV